MGKNGKNGKMVMIDEKSHEELKEYSKKNTVFK